MPIPSRKQSATPPKDAQILESMALTPVSKQTLEVMPSTQTPQEARTQSVNELLETAYQKASMLVLTGDEKKRLEADFDDADFVRGAGGDQEKIYLEYTALKKRLNEVIGLGQWCVINRRSWNEEFTTPGRPAIGKMPAKPATIGVHVYCDAVLLIRGHFVGEAVGEMTYYKNNAASNYSDAYEGSKTAAFRRCCKDFSIGLQAYSKDWCDQWKMKYKGFDRPERKK